MKYWQFWFLRFQRIDWCFLRSDECICGNRFMIYGNMNSADILNRLQGAAIQHWQQPGRYSFLFSFFFFGMIKLPIKQFYSMNIKTSGELKIISFSTLYFCLYVFVCIYTCFNYRTKNTLCMKYALWSVCTFLTQNSRVFSALFGTKFNHRTSPGRHLQSLVAF